MKLKLLYTFLLIVLLQTNGFGQVTKTFTTPGKYTFVVPCDVTSIVVQAWGGGGGGNNNENRGGGGGAFAQSTVSVVGGNTYTVTVGSGASNGTGDDGSDSSFSNIVIARGGKGGGNGGLASASTGTIKYSGGNGGSSSGNGGAGGGASAGTTNDGANGGGTTNDSAGSGGVGLNGGGSGGAGGSKNNNGTDGLSPGGGGGERGVNGSLGSGGGGNGQIIITYTSSLQNYCTPSFNSGVRPITNVSFAGINNPSSTLIGGADLETYCITGSVVQGSVTNAISVKGNTNGNNSYYFKVYIDWDQNGVFGNNTNEITDLGIIASSSGIDAKTAIGNILVPSTAVLGTTKMRVISNYNSTVTGPCLSGNFYGQAEDYLVNVTCGAAGYWTGSTSTDWNLASNWCNGVIPTASTNVVIQAGVTNMPTIAAGTTALCNDLTVNASATLTLANDATSVLNINGNFVNNGTFNAPGTLSKISFVGSNQTLASVTYSNLTLSGNGTKSFGGTINVSNLLAISTGVMTNLGTFQHTSGILTLGGAGPLSGSWGSTSSDATNTNNDFFASTTGKINISSTTPYPPAIDNNYAWYTNGISGQVAGTSGEYGNDAHTIPGSLTLSAPPGSAFINVKFASYGSPGGTSPNFTIGSCHAFNSRAVTTGFLGNNVATIPPTGVAFNAIFGDPCRGIVKSYNVVATYAQPFCKTGGVPQIDINGSTPTGGNGTYSYLWEKSTTSPTTGYTLALGINNGINYTVPANTITGTTYYRRTVTSGIYSDATIVIIQVVEGPPTQPTAFSSVTNACNATTTLSADGGSLGGLGGYVEFYSDSCGGTVVGTSNVIPATAVVSPTVGNTTYYVRYRNSCKMDDTCKSTVVTSPTVSIAAAASALSVCFSSAAQNASLPYTGTSGSPNKYSIIWGSVAISAGLTNQIDSSFSFNAAGGTLNTIAIPANIPGGTYTGTLTVKNNTGCVSFKNIFTLTINALPTAFSVTGTGSYCFGGSGVVVGLSGSQSGVNYQLKNGATNVGSAVAGTGSAISFGSQTTAATYTVVATNTTSCTNNMLGSAVITINPLPTQPSLGAITQPTCATPTGSVVLSGLPTSGSWILKRDNSNVHTSTSGETGSYTDSVLTAPGSSDVTYNFTIYDATTTCASTAVPVVIKPILTTTWNGVTWDNNAPDATNKNKKIVFGPGSYTNYTMTGNLEGCSCQVTTGKSITVNSGVILNLQNELDVKGTLIFDDSASLVQKNNAINTGNIIYKRNTSLLKKYDYVYWGSPVSDLIPGQGQALNGLAANNDLYYSWGGSAWAAEGGNTKMIPGKGYIIRTNTAAPQVASFIGVPNNGDIFYTTPQGAYSLVSNPYPSAISADEFIKANFTLTSTTGATLYFWTHNIERFQNGNQLVYSSNDYASYNLTGGVSGVPKKAKDKENKNDVGDLPTGKIGAGQAFFVARNTDGKFVFNNSMRATGSTDNKQFFRQSNTKKSTATEKNRVWLNLSNDGGAFKQLLVGYVKDATNDYDNLYDGVTYNGNSFVDFYSINNTKSLTIQGRQLPFDSADEVPLGYKTTIAGTFQIGIDDVDGDLVDQPIYVEDKLTNKTHNLKSGDYSFTTEIGTFNDRFVLRYTDTSKLGTGDFETQGKGVIVSVKSHQIKVNSFDETISSIKVYDLKGSLIYEKGKINKNEFIIDHLKSSNQFLIVMTQLENGKWISEEVIFHD